MIKGVHHVSIAVKNLDEHVKVYQELFGFKAAHTETLPDQGVRATLIKIGNEEIELIEPIDANSAVAKFIERKGEGLHHICLEVDDIDKALQELESRGIELIDKKPRKGLAGMIGFIHPRAAKGILIELAQTK